MDVVLTIAALLCACLLAVLLFRQQLYLMYCSFRIREWKQKFPGPVPSYPDGNGKKMAEIGNLQDALNKWHLEYGPVITYWTGYTPNVSVSDPKVYHPLLNAQGGDRGPLIQGICDFIGLKGLLVLKGGDWKRRRSLLVPMMRTGNIKKAYSLFQATVEPYFQRWKEACGTQQPIDMLQEVERALAQFNMMFNFGCKVDFLASGSKRHPLLECIDKDLLLMGKQSSSGGLTRRELQEHEEMNKFVSQFVKTLIAKGKENMAEDDEPSNLLEMLITEQRRNPEFTDFDIEQEVQLFLIAAQETTQNTIAFFLHSMSTNPEWQERVATELLDGLSSDKPVSFEELGKFELFNRCMKESARIHTVVTVNSRVVEEDVEVNGVILPAKTNILVNHSATHHDPAIWDDPEEFKPDRFLPTDNDTHHPLDYSPFGAGPRVCIGERIAKMEYRYMCIEFLRRFKASWVEGTPFGKAQGLAMRPAHPINVLLELRGQRKAVAA